MILSNPFHILGLPADCGIAEKTQRESEAKAYLRVGKRLEFRDDLYFRGCRRNQATVERALSKLHDARDRIGYGLFWFTGSGILDSHALAQLKRGDLVSALDAWARIEHREPTPGHASSLNNLGTLCLLIALSGPTPQSRWPPGSKERAAYFERGLAAKVRLVGTLSEPDFAAFCRTFSDDIAARDPAGAVSAFERSLFDAIAEAETYGIDVSTATIVQVLKAGGPRIEGLTAKVVLGAREELQRAIDTCATAYEHDPSKAGAASEQLVEVTREKLRELAAVMPKSDIRYASIADNAANEILSASVAFYNWRAKRGRVPRHVLAICLRQSQYCTGISCGAASQERARQDVATVKRLIAEHKHAERCEMSTRR